MSARIRSRKYSIVHLRACIYDKSRAADDILRLLIADISEISAELTVLQIKVNIILIDREQIQIKIVIDNRAVDIFNS